MHTYAIILAAGKGTRMKSSLPKVMHPISGIPMIEHITRTLRTLNVDQTIIVTGHEAETIETHFSQDPSITFVRQTEQLGTAHAVMQAASLLENKEGKTLVLTGDTPLLTEETLRNLLEKSTNTKGIVLTTRQENPYGYGRIVRDNDDNVVNIVEEKDATDVEKAINEVNTGIFCFDNETLFSSIYKINNNNAQREYYLTDIVKVFHEQNESFDSVSTTNHMEVMGINDRYQLSIANDYHQENLKKKHMLNGVTMLNPSSTYIEEDVIIENDSIIEGNVSLKGRTVIGAHSVVTSGSEVKNAVIGQHTTITSSVIHDSTVGNHVSIGPFAHIRPLSFIEDSVRIGNFVEVKKSTIDKGSKVSHLSYIGDALIGKDVNVGCGSITVNYDGKNKFKTIIEDNAFIGCNVNLIAPVTVGKDSLVAAGSTVTKNVPEDALAIARTKQENKEGYASKLKK